MISKLKKLGSLASISLSTVAAVMYLIVAAERLLEFLPPAEVLIAVSSVVVAVITGALSVYIARFTKALPRQRRIFLSYSHEEHERARKLKAALEEKGAKVWFDEYSLQPGDDIQSSIKAAIESSNTMIAVVSSRIGAGTAAELDAAVERHVPVIVVLPEGNEAPESITSKGKIQIMREGDFAEIATAALRQPAVKPARP